MNRAVGETQRRLRHEIRRRLRRNELSDFVNINNRNGKIAMKLDEGDGIVGVQVATEKDDVLLTTRGGKCIRFAVGDVRVQGSRLHWACAASSSRPATTSSASRCSAIPARRLPKRAPI